MHYIAFGLPGPIELSIIAVIFLITVVLSLLVGFAAWNFGRSPIAWFLLSFLATPLIAFIALFLVGRVDPEGRV